jgi:hypothetical protein
MDELDPMAEAAYRAAECGGAPPMTFHVPPDATIRLAEGEGHLLTGATITGWAR